MYIHTMVYINHTAKHETAVLAHIHVRTVRDTENLHFPRNVRIGNPRIAAGQSTFIRAEIGGYP